MADSSAPSESVPDVQKRDPAIGAIHGAGLTTLFLFCGLTLTQILPADLTTLVLLVSVATVGFLGWQIGAKPDPLVLEHGPPSRGLMYFVYVLFFAVVGWSLASLGYETLQMAGIRILVMVVVLFFLMATSNQQPLTGKILYALMGYLTLFFLIQSVGNVALLLARLAGQTGE